MRFSSSRNALRKASDFYTVLPSTDTGQVFTQTRTVSRGSNWPSNIAGNLKGPPRPCVIAIQRKDSDDRFV